MSKLWLIHQGGINHETTEVGCQDQRHGRQTKATAVLEGLKGKPVAAICQDYQISQSQYCQWRDQLLTHAAKAFEAEQQSQRETRL